MKLCPGALGGCALVIAVLFGAGCSSGAQDTRPVSHWKLETAARARGVELPEVVVPYELSDEMIVWLASRVPPIASDDESKLRYLSNALFDRQDFGIEYERDRTSTAIEVFRDRRANCLAFTNLFIGMSRELGVETFFVTVRDVEKYYREADLIVVSDHVAVGHGPDHELKIIDFSARPADGYRQVRRISDLRAIAMYYSNRGAVFLRQGDYDQALDWLRGAVAIDPWYAASWVNLGVAFRRAGYPVAAENAYRQALEVDVESTTAMYNLAGLLRTDGREAEARDLLDLMAGAENQNPYILLSMGDLNMRHGNWEAAGRFYRRALRGNGEDAETLAAMGLWFLEQGGRRRAEGLLRKAEAVGRDSQRVDLLRSRLSSSES